VPYEGNSPSATIRLVVCSVSIACTLGCATSFDRQSDSAMSLPETALHYERLLSPTSSLDTTPVFDSKIDQTWRSNHTSSGIVSCSGSPALSHNAAWYPSCDRLPTQIRDRRPLGDDLRLRPPLRQSWAHQPSLVPFGQDNELGLPDSEILAHRDRVTSRPFRNPYAGLRDQPLLHRDSSRAPVTDSTLPELGPPPPHHTVKTFTVFTVASLVGIGVYALAPSSFTGATKDGQQYQESWDSFKDAWTKPPVIDSDNPAVNFLGHPYFGSLYYLSQRNYGESPLYSFLFSTFMSTAFEYFIESWDEQPSMTDLIVTPVVGSIYGELVYRATQNMRQDGFTKGEKIILTIINPLYVIQNGFH
jgi:Domain of unknown function (DUF3943)